MQLHRPRQWGACWLACLWRNVLKALVCYRLIDPGSEWGLLRPLVWICWEKNLGHKLYKVFPHKHALFSFLRQRWQDLFNVDFDVVLYDLTSTCFESDPPESGKRRYWLQPGQTLRLCAGSDCAGHHLGWIPAGL